MRLSSGTSKTKTDAITAGKGRKLMELGISSKLRQKKLPANFFVQGMFKRGKPTS
jgi:ribosomal protein L4